jgi:hypothetical protein
MRVVMTGSAPTPQGAGATVSVTVNTTVNSGSGPASLVPSLPYVVSLTPRRVVSRA